MNIRGTVRSRRPAGFTMVELLVGSAVMLVAVLGALFLYSRSNKVSVEQQMVTEVQNDVRSAMYFLTRDVRMAGAGLEPEFASYFLNGVDNEDQGGDVQPDRIWLMGNLDDPLNLTIQQYQGGTGGGSENVILLDQSLETYSYSDAFYDNKYVIVLPNPESGCTFGAFRTISQVVHDTGGINEKFGFAPGQAPGINPPGGLVGTCPADAYIGGTVSFINVKEYWLDVTGNYPGLTAGQNGYIGGGEGGILYCTTVLDQTLVHLPLARNIENFQVEYCGDLDNDLALENWSPWNPVWGPGQTGRIQQVRVWLLGRTAQAFTSVGGRVPGTLQIYRRPALSNSPGTAADDMHKRFLLESASNVRNMSLNLYNLGQR